MKKQAKKNAVLAPVRKEREDLIFESPTQDFAGFGKKVIKLSYGDGNALCYASESKFFFPKPLDSKQIKHVFEFLGTHGYLR
ncbi:MAG: hypothetical protein EKK64_06815 [Neisseriaceae bacterium]|nr:MAG: hypothetical protein EKK64_06815 [Neisseriaceae bacterium]